MNPIYSIIALIYCFYNSVPVVESVDVKIFFEALCPDSRHFIINQLHPAWKDLSKHDIEISFIPFGKAMSFDDGDHFVCQHGDDECYKNKIMSCALNKIDDKTKKVEYLRCSMDIFTSRRIPRRQKHDASKQCVKNADVEWHAVEDCLKSDQGKNLQLQAEKETMEISPSFIPTIVYNGVFNQTLQDRSLYNFKKTACSFIFNGCS
ncbi:GILT-like protein 1 [Agrilus planipennis]|uniref:GILT-like protein 1 n=1 Tax=Agrilus planipennis TaxID=224129 RepID=A0A7F5RGB7_AGRPL|nr:GILT-like protein 1 [Agrilus planipennis]